MHPALSEERRRRGRALRASIAPPRVTLWIGAPLDLRAGIRAPAILLSTSGANDGFWPILLKNSYAWVWRMTFRGLRWSPEFVAFNSGRSTRSLLSYVDSETLRFEFFNRIGRSATVKVERERFHQRRSQFDPFQPFDLLQTGRSRDQFPQRRRRDPRIPRSTCNASITESPRPRAPVPTAEW